MPLTFFSAVRILELYGLFTFGWELVPAVEGLVDVDGTIHEWPVSVEPCEAHRHIAAAGAVEAVGFHGSNRINVTVREDVGKKLYTCLSQMVTYTHTQALDRKQ